MKNKFLQYTFLGCSLVVLFSACRKDPFSGTETKQSGKDFIYFTEAKVYNQFFDVFTNVKTVTMFTVRKDAASNAVNAKASTVTLTAVPSYIDAYNTKNNTSYTLLPPEIYTYGSATDNVSATGVVATGTGFTLNFAGGDFIKNVIFKIDGSKVDLSKQYAVAYAIATTDGLTKKVGYDTVLATVAIKNRWDGIYTETGSLVANANPAFADINVALGTDAPMQYELRTTSATQCVLYDNYVIGGVYVPCSTTADGAGITYFGNFGLLVNFDPATNKVSSVVNYWGQGTNSSGRSASLDPSGVNAYDPGTKTVTIKYWMIQPSVVPVGPRNIYDQVWTYLKSR